MILGKRQLTVLNQALAAEKQARVRAEAVLENESKLLRLEHAELVQRNRGVELLHSLDEMVGADNNLITILPPFLTMVSRLMRWPIAHAYLPQINAAEETMHLVSAQRWPVENKEKVTAFKAALESIVLNQKTGGLPLKVWRAQEPAWCQNLAQAEPCVRQKILLSLGIQQLYVVPVFIGTETIALLELAHDKRETNENYPFNLVTLGCRYLGLLLTQSQNRQRMLHSAKMATLGQMSANIAHEINNPLAIIHGKIDQINQQIKSKTFDPASASRELEKITTHLERIAKIVQGLKSFSRTGEQVPFESVELAKLLEPVLDICAKKFQSLQIQLKIGPLPSESLECRPIQIEQVLMNLLNNSCDAVAQLPEKWVTLDFKKLEIKNNFSSGQFLQIRITDSGTGIEPEILDRCMQPFFTTKEVGKGTGLGLSISKGILEDHQGQLLYELIHSHTCFIIILPLSQSPYTANRTEERIKLMTADPIGPPPGIPASGPKSDYVGISLSTLRQMGVIPYDLFIRLSEERFVKISKENSKFTAEDSAKYLAKRIRRLYLLEGDAKELFLENQTVTSQDQENKKESIQAIVDRPPFHASPLSKISPTAQLVYDLYQAFGWSEAVADKAKSSIQTALDEVCTSPHLIDLMSGQISQMNHYVPDHSHALIFVASGIGRSLEWLSEYSFTKLSMAAVLHDLTLTWEQGDAIARLNLEANQSYDSENDMSEDVKLYRNHPLLSAQLAKNLKSFPDVDIIIEQHHEKPDGSGFPFGLHAAKIHPLAALFIIAEDLVNFLMGRKDLAIAAQEFVDSRSDLYKAGYFREILKTISPSKAEAEKL